MNNDTLQQRALAHLIPAGQVVELRAFDAKTGRGEWTEDKYGFFDDRAKLAKAAADIDAAGVYFTLNPVNPALKARCYNRVAKAKKGESAADKDIVCRRFLIVDADPTRPAKICATDAEKAQAGAVADAVARHLRALGWPDPLVIDSGNGYYLIYRIDLPADDGERVEKCLKALAHQFDAAAAHIDTGVFNPSRVIRLPGTLNRKGDDLPERPHRRCVALSVPDELRVVPVELLEALAATAPADEKQNANTTGSTAGTGDYAHRLVVPQYLAHFGVGVLSTSGDKEWTRWRVTCPFNPDHSGTDAYVCQHRNGAPTFKCSHNSCSGNKWPAFKERVGKPLPEHYDPPMAAGPRVTLGANGQTYGGTSANGTHNGGSSAHFADSAERVREWPDPVPLNQSPDVPEFPVDVLPTWLREFVVAQAEELQVPVDLPAMLAMAAVGSGVARKVVVTPRAGWEMEPLNLFILLALLPGERKSQVFAKCFAFLHELEKHLRQSAEPIVKEAESNYRVAEGRVKHLETKLAKCDEPDKRPGIIEELKRARQELADTVVPAMPLLRVDDDTPEMLGKELVLQGGRLLAASPEAKAIENITQYGDSPNMDVYLKGHAGDSIRSGRISRGRDEIDRPALTCAFAVQPSVLEEMGETKQLRGKGLLARFYYSIPESKVGERAIGAAAVPAAVRANYATKMTAIWRNTDYRNDDCDPHELRFTPQASALLMEFERRVESRLKPGGDLSRLAGWGNKLCGLCVRWCGNLHTADGEGQPGWECRPIPVGVVARAIKLCEEHAAAHAVAAFDLMGVSESVSGARTLLRWLAKRADRVAEFSKRDAFNNCRGSFDTVAEMEPALELLEQHYLIRPKGADAKTGPGRKSSPVYEVNPAAFTEPTRSQNTHNTQNSSRQTDTRNSAETAYSAERSQPANGHPGHSDAGHSADSAESARGCRVDEETHWWPELLLVLEVNGPMTAERLYELTGYERVDIAVALDHFKAAGYVTETDGVFTLTKKREAPKTPPAPPPPDLKTAVLRELGVQGGTYGTARELHGRLTRTQAVILAEVEQVLGDLVAGGEVEVTESEGPEYDPVAMTFGTGTTTERMYRITRIDAAPSFKAKATCGPWVKGAKS